MRLKPLFLLIILFLSVGQTLAQERGQYLPGFRGLNTAEQPPEGWMYANYFFWYPTSKVKNKNGDRVNLDFDVDLIADANIIGYTPKKKILGATYSASVVVPILNTAVTLPLVGDTGAGGIGDIYFEPVSLGWKLKRGKARVAYGVTAPTGVDGATSHYWGHQATAGATYIPDKMGLWQVNMSSTWEFHHKKSNEDLTVGNNVTFEYGVGKTFVRKQGARLFQVGLVGYSQFQLTSDKGTDASGLPGFGKDRVHAIGPEFGVILPAKKFNFLVRILPEYGARSRAEGVTVMFAFGKSF